MSNLSIFSTLEEVIPVSDEDLRAGIGSLAPQIVTEYVFYMRNVEREIRADRDAAVVENVRLKRELETLKNDLDTQDRNREMLNYLDAPAPPSAPPLYDALPDLPTPSFSGVSFSAAQSSTSPNEQHGCVKQAIDGPAAGCALTHNSDPKIYNVPSTDQWWEDKWLVKQVDSKTYHKIKAIHCGNDEHTRNKPIITCSTKRSPNGYVIQALDGPAAGCTLTHYSDRRSNFSDWVHTQPTSGQGRYDKWQIIKYEDKPYPIYKIKAINSSGDPTGRMLTHGDDGRALVHDTPQGGNDCWNISWVNSKEKSLGCYLEKAKDMRKDKYLESIKHRDETTFWVDVSDTKKTTWRILVQQPGPFGNSQPSPLNTQLFAPAEFSGATIDGHWGTSKIFNKKWGGPLFCADFAMVHEDRDYENGTEIAFIKGPGEDGAHYIEYERQQERESTKVLWCYKSKMNKMHYAMFRSHAIGKSNEQWEIKEHCDGYYMIINKEMGQQLYCDDAKDGRGNHKVLVGSNYLEDDSGLWELQRIIKSDS